MLPLSLATAVLLSAFTFTSTLFITLPQVPSLYARGAAAVPTGFMSNVQVSSNPAGTTVPVIVLLIAGICAVADFRPIVTTFAVVTSFSQYSPEPFFSE